MARLLPVCGPARWVYPAKPPYFTLRELEDHVRTNAPQGFVELVIGFHYGSYVMLVAEDGIGRDLPVNDSASILARREIRGNAVLVTAAEWDDLPLLRDVWIGRCEDDAA